ncbi:MAG: hypothetical protein A2Y54_11275 [Chloroflexi bacterium RBG_16_51_16]|nr:MAG: hypothetical protein A2Y54_11275 [Chloroflexi bacterium RBG_16_51_16]
MNPNRVVMLAMIWSTLTGLFGTMFGIVIKKMQTQSNGQILNIRLIKKEIEVAVFVINLE